MCGRIFPLIFVENRTTEQELSTNYEIKVEDFSWSFCVIVGYSIDGVTCGSCFSLTWCNHIIFTLNFNSYKINFAYVLTMERKLIYPLPRREKRNWSCVSVFLCASVLSCVCTVCMSGLFLNGINCKCYDHCKSLYVPSFVKAVWLIGIYIYV